MERQIRERFGRLARSASPRARPAVPVPDHAQPLISVATDPEETATTVSVFFKRDARRDSTVAGYRRQIAEQLFDQITNERYYEISVKPDAPFAYAYAGQSGLVRTEEAYSVGVGVKDGGAEAGLRAALMEVERLARFGFTETELARARANSLRSMEQAFAERDKTNSGVFASEYVRAFLSGESFPGIAYEYDLYKRFVPEVEVAELNAMAREVLAPGNRVILASGPEKVGAELPTSERFLALFGEASGAQLSAYADSVSDAALIPVPPVPGSVTSVQRIEELGVTEWILSNGVRMVLKPTDFKQDEIRMSGFSPGGTSLASNSDAFVMENASIAIEVGGIGAFDQVALSKRLAGKAAGASPYISSLEEGIGGSASPKDVETMFELVHLYFTSPRKDSSAFEAFKQSARAMLENASADPDGVYSDTLTRVLTNYHPRVRLISAGMLDSLDLDRSLTFYKERFADASDFTFVVVGNFSVDSLRPLVEKYIASLPALNRRETWRDNGVRPPSELVKKVVRRGLEPKGQTSLIFTGPVEFTRANRFALGALSEVLSIRLREVLREALGGTYDVSAYGSASRDPWQSYSFSISFGSAPERVDTLVRAVFAEIDSLKANGPKAQDIDKVRETMRRAYETNLTQNGYWMGQLVAYYRLGENPRQILSYPEVIATLSAELVRAAASRFLDASRYIQLSLLPER
jgi:zinc protease